MTDVQVTGVQVTDVHVTDRIVLTEEQVGPWLRRWRTDYLPGARARGMTLLGVRHAHTGTESVALSVAWRLSDPYAFYAMRAAAAADPGVAAFWAYTDDLAVARDRRASRTLEESA